LNNLKSCRAVKNGFPPSWHIIFYWFNNQHPIRRLSWFVGKAVQGRRCPLWHYKFSCSSRKRVHAMPDVTLDLSLYPVSLQDSRVLFRFDFPSWSDAHPWVWLCSHHKRARRLTDFLNPATSAVRRPGRL
jgi:hypothetical protein